MSTEGPGGGTGVGPGTSPGDEDPRVVAALEEYAAMADGGRAPSRGEFLARHGSIAGPLGECLAGMDLVDDAAAAFGPTTADASASGRVDAPPLASLGEFRIVREIGRGGMGVVYEAEQRPLGRRVALKVLPSAASMDPRQRQRFQVEAHAAALLHHEHIVPVFAVGVDRGVHFYAMQLIEGRPLTRIIRESAEGDRPATPASSSSRARAWAREAARLGLQAAEALEHAHALGIVHRDVKPGNLLVDVRGNLWVADFGLARTSRDEPDLTRTGDLVGTLRYMSPEQVRAARGGVGPASDVYSLGATLYELLTRRPAFDADDRQELIRRILEDEPPRPRKVAPPTPRDLETIVLKAMEKDPSARYASAAAMADDLRRFLDDQPIHARRPGLADRAVKWSRRHRAAVAAGLAAVVVSLTVATAVLWDARRRTSAALERTRASLLEERLAIEYALGELDMITRPLAGKVDDGAKWTLSRAIAFYDRIPRMNADAGMLREVVPKALRQAAFCRTALGQPRGLDDYRRAVRLYEDLASDRPEQVWLRTALIETLLEYSRARKGPEAEAAFRRALEVAAATADDPKAAAPCFATALAGPLDDLARTLVLRPGAPSEDLRIAARLAARATEWGPSRADFRDTLARARSRLDEAPASRP